MAPPPELHPDIVDEVLVRLSRDDPAGFIRASAVCKSWLGTLTNPAFLRRYRDMHGTAPLVLGFLHNPVDRRLARFVPTTAFRPPAATDHGTTVVLDCRHGRALFYDYGSTEFVVWDPITGRERRMPDDVLDTCTNHAVLCAAGTGCDHSACNEGPFIIASAGVECHEYEWVQADAWFVNSETGERGGPDGLYLDSKRYRLEEGRAAVLVAGALYFVCENAALLRYDVLGLGTQDLSVIEPPPGKFRGSKIIVRRAENGGLGLATLRHDVLQLWSAETRPRGDVKWAKMNRIQLRKLTPFKRPARLIGYAEDINVVFVRSDDHCIFTIELKSLLMKKLCEMDEVDDVFPYVCFYNTPTACARGRLPAPDLQ